MLKNMLKLGTALDKEEQQTVHGGTLWCLLNGVCVTVSTSCPEWQCRPAVEVCMGRLD